MTLLLLLPSLEMGVRARRAHESLVRFHRRRAHESLVRSHRWSADVGGTNRLAAGVQELPAQSVEPRGRWAAVWAQVHGSRLDGPHQEVKHQSQGNCEPERAG